MNNEEHSVDAARSAAERDELGTWVTRFLASPGSDNAALAEHLSERVHSWTGPVELPLDRLHRLAGPPEDPVLCPVDDDYWDGRVDDMPSGSRTRTGNRHRSWCRTATGSSWWKTATTGSRAFAGPDGARPGPSSASRTTPTALASTRRS
jgi:hypothetical protein